MSSPWLGCSMTVLTAARDWYSRWHPGARRSQIRTVPSSEPEYIHLLSFWNPTCAAGKRVSVSEGTKQVLARVSAHSCVAQHSVHG